MEVVSPRYYVETEIDSGRILKKLELCGRVAYKSEDKITDDSADKFIRGIIKSGHESVLEHEYLSIRFVVDRGVTHELVRHRLCAFTQESTRYCNYNKKGITYIKPVFFDEGGEQYQYWLRAMSQCETEYNMLIESGASPQEARSVLPNSLKTEIVCTADMREWRHILKLRTAKGAHPQMREVMVPLLEELKNKLGVLFEDI